MKNQWIYKFFSASLIVMLALAVLPVSPARAATAGPNNAGTGSNVNGPGTIAWTNPGNITLTGAPYATSALTGGTTSEYLQATNYGFSIPAGATIDGITVTINRQSNSSTGGNSVDDSTVQLIKGGSIVGSNLAVVTDWPTSLQNATYGSASNLWGTTWTPAEINASNFGVSLSVLNESGTASRTATVNTILITVTYTLEHTITVTAGAGGTITPAGPNVVVDDGEDEDFDIEPNANFIVSDVLIGGVSQGRINYYEFNNVTADNTIEATFDGGWSEPNDDTDSGWGNTDEADDSDNQYADANGAGDIAIFSDFDLSFPPSATINGIEVAIEGNAETTGEVSVDLSWNNGGGYTGSDPSTSFVNGGEDATNVLGGVVNTWGRTWSVSELSNANFQVRLTTTGADDINIDQVQVKVHFTAPTHTITASAGAGGTINPSGAVVLYEGFDQDFDITPSTSFIVSDIVVDGGSVGRINYYEFTNVLTDHTIVASFDGGWSQPSADVDTGWGNEDEAYVSDNDYALANADTDVAQFFNFGLSIPSGATILGIEVAIEGNAETTRELVADLSWNNGTNFTSTATTNFVNGGDEATYILGGPANTWGRTWSPTEFSNANFRLRLDATGGGGDIFVDQVQVKVYYTTNTPPTGTDNTITINEDATHTFAAANFGFNDADAGDSMSAVRIDTLTLPVGSTLQLSSVDVTAGQVILTANIPNLVFTPAANANGTGYASFTFSVRDTNGPAFDTTPNTMTFNITDVNDEPSFTASNPPAVNEDAGAQAVSSWATFNDGDPEVAQTATFSVSNLSASCATLLSTDPTVNAAGDLSYTPATNANGICTFDVSVQDNGGTANGGDDTSPTQNFTITVNAVDDASTANDDTATVTEDDSATTIDVRGNDSDIDSAIENIISVIQPTNGTVVITNGGLDLTYQPDANYCNGGSPTDDFTYTLTNGSTADVFVTVTCVDDFSTANDDTATVTEDDSATTIDVRGNDSDIDTAVENIASVIQPTNGTVVITNGGLDLTYQPDANYCNGGSPTDDFTYTLTNGSTADVFVTVTCVDDASTANDDTATVWEDSGANTINVRSNDTDNDSTVENITSVTQPTNGTVAITNAGADLTYQPDAEYCNNGTPTDDFTYILTGGDSATVQVTVNCQTAITTNITANNKVYDGDNTATFSCSLTGVTPPDVVTCTGGTATFTDKNVGNAKLVTATGLGLTGADAFKYELSSTSATTNANITERTLNVTATGIDKVYDGNTDATVTLSDDRFLGDLLTVSYTSASFVTPNVGVNITINVSGINITGGADASNYVLGNTTAVTDADITIAGQTINEQPMHQPARQMAHPSM